MKANYYALRSIHFAKDGKHAFQDGCDSNRNHPALCCMGGLGRMERVLESCHNIIYFNIINIGYHSTGFLESSSKGTAKELVAAT